MCVKFNCKYVYSVVFSCGIFVSRNSVILSLTVCHENSMCTKVAGASIHNGNSKIM
jgi:hypothetical protein